MMGPISESCADCGVVLSTRGSKYERAALLSGGAYCTACITKLSFTCEKCARPILLDDFEQGRAMTLLGSKYCEGCLESAVRRTRSAEPARPAPEVAARDRSSGNAWGAHRAHPRFVPPLDCRLTVRRPGLRGLMGGDRLSLWVDVSEGGMRVILRGKFEVDQEIQGELVHPSLGTPLSFRAAVRHAKRSRRYQEATLIGVRFEAPSVELRAFIRDTLSVQPSLVPPPVRKKPATVVPPPRGV